MKNTAKIINSNKACKILEANGYILQGQTEGMKGVAILKNEKLLFFKDYIQASKQLIKN